MVCSYYQLLTREPPFGGDIQAVMYQHCNEPFPDAGAKVGGLPDGVLRTLGKGTQKRPSNRYPPAAELLADLDAVPAAPPAAPEASHVGERSLVVLSLDRGEMRKPFGQVLLAMLAILKGRGLMGKLTWDVVVLTLGMALAVSIYRGPAAGGAGGAAGASVAAPSGKRPAPASKDQHRAEQTIRGLFRTDYVDHTPAGKLALARKLLSQGSATEGDAALQFVCFGEARDLASAAGDLPTALAAVDALDKEFAVDAVEMRAVAFVAAAPLVPAEASSEAVETGLPLLEQAVAAEDFPTANRLLGALEAAANRSKQLPLVARVQAKRAEVAEVQQQAGRLRLAREALKKDPNDPAANLAVGRSLALSKGDWAAALPMLARGSDPALKGLAVRELAKTGGANDQLQLADGWWDLSAKLEEPARSSTRRHAAGLYAAVRPGLSGADAGAGGRPPARTGRRAPCRRGDNSDGASGSGPRRAPRPARRGSNHDREAGPPQDHPGPGQAGGGRPVRRRGAPPHDSRPRRSRGNVPRLERGYRETPLRVRGRRRPNLAGRPNGARGTHASLLDGGSEALLRLLPGAGLPRHRRDPPLA